MLWQDLLIAASLRNTRESDSKQIIPEVLDHEPGIVSRVQYHATERSSCNVPERFQFVMINAIVVNFAISLN